MSARASFSDRIITLGDGGRALVRGLGPGDASAIHEHLVRAAPTSEHVLTVPGDVPSAAVLRNDFDRVFDAERGGVLLGVFDPGDAWVVRGTAGLAVRRQAKVAHVAALGMMLEPAWRGRGLGRALVEALLVWARAHGRLRRVELEVVETNAAGLALYRRCGFVEEGRRRGAFCGADGRDVDVVQMGVVVGDGTRGG